MHRVVVKTNCYTLTSNQNGNNSWAKKSIKNSAPNGANPLKQCSMWPRVGLSLQFYLTDCYCWLGLTKRAHGRSDIMFDSCLHKVGSCLDFFFCCRLSESWFIWLWFEVKMNVFHSSTAAYSYLMSQYVYYYSHFGFNLTVLWNPDISENPMSWLQYKATVHRDSTAAGGHKKSCRNRKVGFPHEQHHTSVPSCSSWSAG